MLNALLGFFACAVLFTFFPTLGMKISDSLKSARQWFRSKAH